MTIAEQLNSRILILDGAMGTRIQALGVGADSFHRGRFAQWPVSLAGNNDVLCLTAPDVIKDIHRRYVEAGADIITTNTFSANRISQQEYHCDDVVRDMAQAGARLARQVADEFINIKKVWVAGSMGPTSKSLSLASDMSRPAQRAVSFDEMASAYGEQAEALIAGGADMLLLETCFDALNTKAALYAVSRLNERLGRVVPVMVSATINDRSGRTLTGQTLEAFYISICHYPGLVSFGLNCSFGVKELRPFAEQLARRVGVALSLHPNAGLPNEMGEYEELPEVTASYLRQMADGGLLNIAGGCCGTDERHIRAISEALNGIAPRHIPEKNHQLWVSGLEPVLIDREAANFTNVGERTNVAGSRKFARLIASKQYDEALGVARQQIEGGAAVIDINMDDAMLDSREEMQTFLRYIANDPAVGRSALMIDSSDWPTLVAGLKNAQGKCIVNSISLKNGDGDFMEKARELRRLGAAVVVMAFDEEGQATTYERKTEIAHRAYRLLTDMGFPPEEIILDVNILSVGTGVSEHRDYGRDFIRAVGWIKQNLPFAKTSGGVSNLSFAFRGNNTVREAMHSAFLYHAIRAGLDMAIVNPSMLQVYDSIEPSLLRAVEDVILNTDDDATEKLISLAATVQKGSSAEKNADGQSGFWRSENIEKRLDYALSSGLSDYLPEDIPEALKCYGNDPVRVIEEPLMKALEHVGQLFGEGKMFLPQVVKSAKVMKDAVALLQPYMEKGRAGQSTRPVVITATANGDVHDIGKNIVGIVLGCNGFDVRDLGVMVPADTILQETLRLKPCMVGISGLITPSLKEMELLCRLFQQHRLHVPIVVGGATTSALHTAVRLAPLYDGLVVHGGDASQTSLLAKRLLTAPEETERQIRAEQQQIRDAYSEHHSELTPYEEANRRGTPERAEAREFFQHISLPKGPLLTSRFLPVADVAEYIDWRMFLLFWGFKGETLQQQLVNPEAARMLSEGRQWLREAIEADKIYLRGLLQFEDACRQGNDILLADGQRLPMLRSQSAAGHCRCVADFFDEKQPRPIGLFTIAASMKTQATDDTTRLMGHALCARLAEAAAEWMQSSVVNGQLSVNNILRVAFGYATCPDHSLKRIVFDRLDAETLLDVMLTDRYSIQPSTAICGLFIIHPDARYFPVGMIDRIQLADYCLRRGITTEEGEHLLSKYVK